MAKSTLTRVLIDESGKSYRFSNEALKIMIDYHSKKTGVTKQTLQTEIAKKACVSPDAVKNWCQGNNGPGSIDNVKACADVLNVDYVELLEPTNNEEKINEYEIQLIEKIYQMCVSIIYDFQKVSYKVKQNLPDKPKGINTRIDLLSYVSGKIIDCFEVIDQSSLRTSLPLRDKLRRILFRFRLLFSGDWDLIPEEWMDPIEDMVDVFTFVSNGKTWEDFFTINCDEETLSTLPTIAKYLEWRYTSRMGIKTNCPKIQDDDSSDREKEVFLSAHNNNISNPVDPGTLYIERMVMVMETIFKREFPNIFMEDICED